MNEIYQLFLKSSGIVTDTRKIIPNCLFVALKGENFNGNTFAQSAIESGAIAAIIDEVEFERNDKTILVSNALETLQLLANHHRKQFNIPIIGITGSNGKTTSKELIATVLETSYNVHYTLGNLNNHIGVPLTLLQLNAQHEIAVIEMGANKPGDIKELVEIAEPTHGIITNIGRAHLEGFKNLEGVIKTKTELYNFIEQTKGILFVNAEDELLMRHLPSSVQVETYNDPNSLSGTIESLTPYVQMTWKDQTYRSPKLETQLIGEYNFINFLAAIKIGRFFDVSAEKCSEAITAYTPTNNRSQVTKTERNTVIVDCYNANPTSMKSAIQSFARIAAHPKVFVLGDMREMGDEAEKVHEEIVQLTIDHLLSGFFIGEEFLKFKGMHPQAIFLKSTDPLIEHFKNVPPEDLMILLKGSRGIALEKVLPFL